MITFSFFYIFDFTFLHELPPDNGGGGGGGGWGWKEEKEFRNRRKVCVGGLSLRLSPALRDEEKSFEATTEDR